MPPQNEINLTPSSNSTTVTGVTSTGQTVSSFSSPAQVAPDPLSQAYFAPAVGSDSFSSTDSGALETGMASLDNPSTEMVGVSSVGTVPSVGFSSESSSDKKRSFGKIAGLVAMVAVLSLMGVGIVNFFAGRNKVPSPVAEININQKQDISQQTLTLQAGKLSVVSSSEFDQNGVFHKDLTVEGTLHARVLTGDGSQLTNINATSVISGTLNDSQLSSRVTLQGNSFNGSGQLLQLDKNGKVPLSLNGGADRACVSGTFLDSIVTQGGVITGGTCTILSSSLQDAFNHSSSPATITTSDGKNFRVQLVDTAVDQTFEISQAGAADIFRVNDDGTFSDSTPFVIDSNGNVAIGTTTPSSALDLNGAFTIRGISAPSLSSAGQGRIYYDSALNSLRVSENGGIYNGICNSSGNCIGGGGGASNSAAFLTIGNDATLLGERAITAVGNLTSTDNGANSTFTINTVNNPNFSTSVTTPLITTTSGDLTLDPTGNTVIKGSTTDNTAAAVNIQNSLATSLLFVRNDGNVGIGNSAPVALFSVGSSSQFQVSSAGAITAVGVDSGTGLIQGTGGLTITGTSSLTGSTTIVGVTNVNTTGTAATSIGNSTGALTVVAGNYSLTSSGLNVTTAGALSGITTISTSGTINSQTISSTANFTGTLAVAGNLTQTAGSTISAGTGFKINGAAATAATYLRGDGTNFVSSAIQAGDLPAGSNGYIFNQSSLQSSSNFHISGTGTADGSFSSPIYTSTGAVSLTSGGTNTDITIDAIGTGKTVLADSTINFSAGSTTLDLTGAATNTLTILNSTASQVTDLDLSDGSLKIAGATRINNAGAGTFVGVDAGTGLLQGALGLTVTGAATNLNVSSNFATNINTGTSSGTITLGGGSAPLVIDSTNFDVSSAGAVSGVTTLSTSGIITAGALGASTGSSGICRNSSNQISTCSGSGSTDINATLQNAYVNGNTISTNGNNIGFTLNSSQSFTVATAAGATGSTTFSLTDGSNASSPAQLVLITNNDINEVLASGLKVTSAAGLITTAIDASGANITNALAIGAHAITGTNFSVTGAGAVTAVGVNSGTGLLQGALGLTVTGAATNLNVSSNFATNINTGTSNGAVTIGNAANTPLTIASTGLNVTTAGALSGITTISTSSTINSQTISSTANFTGTLAVAGNLTQTAGSTISAGTGFKINGAAATAATYLRGDGTNFVSSAIQAGDLPAGSNGYIFNQSSLQATSNFHISGTGTADTSFSTPTITTASGDLTIDPVGNTIIKGSVATSASAALDIQNSTTSILFVRNDGNVGIGTNAPASLLQTLGGHITLGAFNSSTAAEIRFREGSTNGTEYIALKAPNDVGAASFTFTLPNSYGSNGQVLKSDGSGGLSWTANSATGMTNPMTTTGDLIYASDTGTPSTASRLGIGTAGQCFIVSSGLPAWGACSGTNSTSGSDTQVQFNDAGIFGAVADFTFSKTPKTLAVTGTTAGTQTSLAIRNSSTSSSAIEQLKIGNDTQDDTLLIAVNGANVSGAGNVASITNKTNAALTFGTNNSTRITIEAGGNVGIGDASPTALLTVGSGDLFQVNSSGAIAAAVGITSAGATVNLNASSNFATNINTGTSNGTITLGGGSAPLVIDSTNFDVSSAGAVSGVTTLSTSGIITAGALGASTGSSGICRNSSNQISTCSGSGTTDINVNLQNAYVNGNTISTNGNNIGFTLNSSQSFTVATAAGATGSTTFSLTDGSNASSPAQLVLITNNDINEVLASGLKVTSAAGLITTAIDASGANITNALAIGAHAITGTNFSVTGLGAVTAVGVNSGSGLIQGTGGLTITGTSSLTGATTIAGTTNINATGTSATSIGNSTGVLTLASGGVSGWTNTAGNLTISTATSGTLALTSAGALNLTGAAASTLSTSAGALTLTSAAAATWSTSAGALTIQGNTSVSLDSATTGAVSIGTNANAKTITIGNNSVASEIDLLGTTGVKVGTLNGTSGSTAICQNASSFLAACSGSGGTSPAVTLQNAYANTNGNTISLTTGRDLVFTSPDVATDPNILIDLQCTTCSASGGRFAIQNSTVDVFAVNPNNQGITLGANTTVSSGKTFTVTNGATSLTNNSGTVLSVNTSGSGSLVKVSNTSTGSAVNVFSINNTGDTVIKSFPQFIASGSVSFANGTDSAAGSGTDKINSVFNYGRWSFVAKAGNSGTCDASTKTGCELQIYDVSNPSSPVYLAGSDSDAVVTGGTGSGNYTSVAYDNGFVFVTRDSDRTATVCTGGASCELHIYKWDGTTLSTENGIDSSGTIRGGTSAKNFTSVFASNGLLYVTQENSSTGANCTTASEGCEIKIYKYYKNDNSTMTIKYVAGSDANGNTATAGSAADEQVNTIFASGNYVYAGKQGNSTACGSATAAARLGCEFQVYSLTMSGSTGTLTYVGGIDANGSQTGTGSAGINSIFVSGQYAYVGQKTDGTTNACSATAGTGGLACELKIINISVPSSLSYVAGIDLSGSVNSGTTGTASGAFNSVFVSGYYLFAAKTDSAANGTCSSSTANGCEMQVFDVSAPSAPIYRGGTDSTNTGTGTDSFNAVYVSSGYAYVGKSGNSGTCSTSDRTGCELQVYGLVLNSNSAFSVQDASGTNLFNANTANMTVSLPSLSGGFNVNRLISLKPTLDNTSCSTSAITWGYRVAAFSSTGESLASAQVTATCDSTIDSSHYITISWTAVIGASGYNVYRTLPTTGGTPSTLGIIGTVYSGQNLTLKDSGLVGGNQTPILAELHDMSNAIGIGLSGKSGSGSLNNIFDHLDVNGRINSRWQTLYTDFLGYNLLSTSGTSVNNFIDGFRASLLFNNLGNGVVKSGNPDNFDGGNLTLTSSQNNSTAARGYAEISSGPATAITTSVNPVAETKIQRYGDNGTFKVLFGFLDGTEGQVTPLRGAWFESDQTLGLSVKTANQSGSTTTVCTFSNDILLYGATLRIELSTDNAKFYINGILSCTAVSAGNANYPDSGVGYSLQLVASGTSTLTTTGVVTIYAHYLKVWSDDPPEGARVKVTSNSQPASTSPHSNADLAEAYSSDDKTLGFAEIAKLDPLKAGFVTKSTQKYEQGLVGVVSTSPGQVLAATGSAGEKPIALAGRVLVKIAPNSPAILPGDFITSSDSPGLGEKAEHSGWVIGKALEPWEPNSGKDSVLMFIDNTWFGGVADSLQGSGPLRVNNLVTKDDLAQLAVGTGDKANKGIVVQGVDGQTGDLFQAQSASGSVLASINAKGDLTVQNATIKGNLVVAGHIITGGKAPTLEMGSVLGLNGQLQIEGNDTAGTLKVTSGVQLGDGDQVLKLIFDKVFIKNPKVILSPKNSPTSGLKCFNESNNSNFILHCSNVQPGTQYMFDYLTIE